MDGDEAEYGFLPELAAALGLPLRTPPRRFGTDIGAMRLSGVYWGEGDPGRVLVHGGGLNAHAWDGVVLALDGSILAVDLAGHGHSEWFDEAVYTPDRLAEATIAHADRIGLRRPRLFVGHSLGGLVSIEVAACRPDLVSGVILVDVTPARASAERERAIYSFIGSGASFADLDELFDYARAHGMGGEASALRRSLVFNSRRRDDGRLEFRHHFAHLSPGDVGVTWEPESIWQALARIEVPVTLVRAADGAVGEDSVRRFREVRPADRVVEIPGGHNVPQRFPVELAKIIAEHPESLGDRMPQ